VHPTLFHIGSLSVKTYGLMMAIAFISAIILARRRAKKAGLDPRQIEVICYALIGMGLLGTRVLYTFGENTRYYLTHPIEFFYLHEGGLSFVGGLYFVVPTLFFLCRRKQLSFWTVVDILIPSVALGLGIGKIGCLFAGCCFGKPCDLPWTIRFSDPDGLARPLDVGLHPAQIYESLLWFSLFGVLLGFQKFRRFPGEMFLLFAAVYALVRPFLESLRGEPRYVGNLTTVPFLSVPMILLTAGAWVYLRRRSI